MSNLITEAQRAGASVGLTFDRITIEGGKPLQGEVDVRGAKNLVTKAMVASLLSEGVSVLRDVPDISDVRVVRGLLGLGPAIFLVASGLSAVPAGRLMDRIGRLFGRHRQLCA